VAEEVIVEIVGDELLSVAEDAGLRRGYSGFRGRVLTGRLPQIQVVEF
jgi:hypothetical protein